jgi:hypothetical protein
MTKFIIVANHQNKLKMSILSNRDFTNGKAFLDTGCKFGQVEPSSKNDQRRAFASSNELLRVNSVDQSVTPHK